MKIHQYQGKEILRSFGVPVPRGIPILPTATACTAEINRARTYLDKCLASV